jgi:uncharacterized protein
VALEATIAASGSYSLLWSNGSTSSAIRVWPLQTTTYTLSITDESGCTSIDEVTVYVQDISCGSSKDMVQLCFNGNTLCVTQALVAAYLAQGAALGPCREGQQPLSQDLLPGKEPRLGWFSVYPNPVAGQVATIEFMLGQSLPFSLDLYSLQGGRIVQLGSGIAQANQMYQISLDASSLPTGLYLTRLIAGEKVHYLKIIRSQAYP